MATVVVTGSTRGIGRGLAEEFIKLGHNTVICSRKLADVENVTRKLDALGDGNCIGTACDTTDKAQVQALWDHAVQAFGTVDYWINNAGRATSRHEVHELPEDLTKTIITGNVLGTTFGSQVAIAGFRKQGSGNLYNVLGGSFDGKFLVPNMGVYSSTKAGIHLLSKYLVKENKDHNILVGMISPGMLITENWFEEQQELSDAEWQKIKPQLDMMCDYVDTVTPWLAEQILTNTESGKRIAWMTSGRMLQRFVRTKLLGRKRDLFSRYGL
ncbi:MAG: SDR family oxidoreductase [Gammaproteobacteria bacterium]|jgi:NAD(P)-dependent dehydrogenase (short-subunit alcohol dehydrogenase family)|nr:SDR family oxidoreductase [Gammaproteobacteria bacterium]MDP7093637.1 SDR family oxidoreductase [Gammaproteobacteria bacterium]MDP7271156.1 SDR family oxidoreductase [Gammaproteobacteria bacterium]HJP04247.1 SDR family oxidoreductase [Gammaproteobacteria bacterium]